MSFEETQEMKKDQKTKTKAKAIQSLMDLDLTDAVHVVSYVFSKMLEDFGSNELSTSCRFKNLGIESFIDFKTQKYKSAEAAKQKEGGDE